MFKYMLRNSLVLSALVSVVGLTAMSSPSLAFNPQPDPQGHILPHSPPSDGPEFQTSKPLVLAAKPDCKNQKGRTNPCS